MTRRRLEDAVEGPRGGSGDQGQRSVRRTALYAPERPARRLASAPVRIPTAPLDSPRTCRRATVPFGERGAKCAALPYREAWRTTVADWCTDRRLRRGAARPEPTPGRPEWPGLGLTGAGGGRVPHRACAAPRVPGGSRGRSRGRASSGPSRLSLPIRPGSNSTVCPSAPRLGGRPPLPDTHRYQRGGLPAAPSPQARRRRRLRLSPPARRRTKAPPTDRRGHEAMAVGAESGGRGRARSGRRGNVATARGFTAGLSWGVDLLSKEGGEVAPGWPLRTLGVA